MLHDTSTILGSTAGRLGALGSERFRGSTSDRLKDAGTAWLERFAQTGELVSIGTTVRAEAGPGAVLAALAPAAFFLGGLWVIFGRRR